MMNNFVKALQTKIHALNDERHELWEAVRAIDAKLELLSELYLEEAGEAVEVDDAPAPKKRRAGRPKGAKNKKSVKGVSKHAPADDLFDEAMAQLKSSEEGGTTPELQESRIEKYRPVPRSSQELGAGITAGSKKQVDAARATTRKSHATISVDEGE